MSAVGHVVRSGILLGMTLALGLGWLAAVPAEEPITNATVVARVDGEPVLRGAVEDYVWKIIPATTFHRSVSPARFAELRAEGLDKEIVTTLASREGKKAGLDVTKATDATIATTTQQVERKGKKLEQLLADRKQTMQDFRAAIERFELATAYIQSQTAAKVDVPEEEIRKQFESNPGTYTKPEAIRLMHILIRIPIELYGNNNAPQFKTAGEIHKRLKRGENFEDVVKLFKEEISNVDKMDTGFVHRGGMLHEVEDVAFGLKIGEISPVMSSIHGLNIVKLLDRKPAEPIPFDKVHDAIKEQLRKQKVEELRKAVEDRLKAKAKIEILWDAKADRMLPAAPQGLAKP